MENIIQIGRNLDKVDKMHIKEFYEGLLSGLLITYEEYTGIAIIDVFITRENTIKLHLIEENTHG